MLTCFANALSMYDAHSYMARYMATSSVLSQHSHGKGIDAVIEIAAEVIEFVKSHGVP